MRARGYGRFFHRSICAEVLPNALTLCIIFPILPVKCNTDRRGFCIQKINIKHRKCNNVCIKFLMYYKATRPNENWPFTAWSFLQVHWPLCKCQRVRACVIVCIKLLLGLLLTGDRCDRCMFTTGNCGNSDWPWDKNSKFYVFVGRKDKLICRQWDRLCWVLMRGARARVRACVFTSFTSLTINDNHSFITVLTRYMPCTRNVQF